MIIYTSMPLEWVLQGYDQFKPQHEELVYEGVHMVIEPTGPFQGKVVRLLSSDPQDYLNPRFSPGSIIHFRAE